MLEKLIGAQIISIDENSIKVKLNDEVHTLKLDSHDGGCCGYAEFETNMLYSENDLRNPIITNVESVSGNSNGAGDSSVITFYGENKALATIESEAGSGSGYYYGAVVTLHCKTLDIEKDLVSW